MTNPDSLRHATDQASIPDDPVIPGFGGEGKAGYRTGVVIDGKHQVEIMDHEAATMRRDAALGATAVDLPTAGEGREKPPKPAVKAPIILELLGRNVHNGRVIREDLKEAGQQSAVKTRSAMPLAEGRNRKIGIDQELTAVVGLGSGTALGVVRATHHGKQYDKDSVTSMQYLSVLNDDPDSRAVLLGELKPGEPFTVDRQALAEATGRQVSRFVKSTDHATIVMGGRGLVVTNLDEHYETTLFTNRDSDQQMAHPAVWSIPHEDVLSSINTREAESSAALGLAANNLLMRTINGNSIHGPNDPPLPPLG